MSANVTSADISALLEVEESPNWLNHQLEETQRTAHLSVIAVPQEGPQTQRVVLPKIQKQNNYDY